MKPVFGPDLYKHIIRTYGYDDSFFEGFTRSIHNFSASDLRHVFLCHQGLYEFDRAPANTKVVTTGLGLSGAPHIGTLSQIYRLSLLHQSGYRVQLVLGDLDAYNGKNVSMSRVNELAATYEKFIARSGLLVQSDTVTVRRQNSALSVLRTAYLLGRFVDDADFQGANEHIHSFYVKHGKVDEQMSYRRKLSLLLMLADFFDIGQQHPNVLVMLGVDEHQYVRVGQALAQRVNEQESGLKPVTIASIYTPIISGLDGYPKMSKSFPGSGIDLSMDPSVIEAKIMQQPRTTAITDDPIFQMVCAIGLGEEAPEFADIEQAYASDASWQIIKERLAAHIMNYARMWQS